MIEAKGFASRLGADLEDGWRFEVGAVGIVYYAFQLFVSFELDGAHDPLDADLSSRESTPSYY
jgi:hypothetical protein